MGVIQVKSNDEYTRNIRDGLRSLEEYLNVIGFYMDGKLNSALERVEWIRDMYHLDGLADVVLLEASIRQHLPQTHPEYRQPGSDVVEALYKGRHLIGSLRRLIYKRGFTYASFLERPLIGVLWPQLESRSTTLPINPRTKIPATPRALVLPDIGFTVEWEDVGLSLNVITPRQATGAYALSLVASGKYDEAVQVLPDAVPGDPAVVWAARLSLFYRTQRWGDLIAVSDTAIDAQIDAMDNTDEVFVKDAARVLAAHAWSGLGEPEQALHVARGSLRCENPDVQSRILYVMGLAYRQSGDEVKASSAFKKSMNIVPSASADAALRTSKDLVRVTSLDNINARSDYWDPETEPDPEMERRLAERRKRGGYAQRAEALLEQQVGMENVKAELRSITASARTSAERARRGGVDTPTNHNLVLKGPPGTGKTTAAQYLALSLASLGVINDPEPVISHREDFVDNRPGGSAVKTRAMVEKSVGKLLFIDEFYAFVQGPDDAFGREALDTLVAETELRVGEVVFVVAGYGPDINRIMAENAGLHSRFPRQVSFTNYSIEEIADIAVIQAKRKGMMLSDEAYEFLSNPEGRARILMMNDGSSGLIIDSLGNGRFARNLVESAIDFHAQRLESNAVDIKTVGQNELNTLTADDVVPAFNKLIEAKLRAS